MKEDTHLYAAEPSGAVPLGYTPGEPDNWNEVPLTVQRALDIIAERGEMSPILHATATITMATTTELLAVAAGKIAVIYSLDAFCSNGNSADQSVEFKFDSTRIRKHAGVAPGSGFVVGGAGGKVAEGASGEDVDVVTSAAQTVDVAISYRLRDA